jgi:hypothetical protein
VRPLQMRGRDPHAVCIQGSTTRVTCTRTVVRLPLPWSVHDAPRAIPFKRGGPVGPITRIVAVTDVAVVAVVHGGIMGMENAVHVGSLGGTESCIPVHYSW